MKKSNRKFVIGVAMFAVVFAMFAACYNSITERWRDSTISEPPPQNADPVYYAESELTLYAKWVPAPVPVSVSVTFIANSGEPIPAVQALLSGNRAKTPPPGMTLAGYGFGGWFADAGFTNAWDFGTPVAENLVLYAKWNPEPFTVTFVADGGTPKPQSQLVAPGGKVVEPLPMNKEYNGFDGWFTNSTLIGTAWNFAANTVDRDITLHARWNTNTNTVTFVANGGAALPETQVIGHGTRVTRPNPMTKPGYHFGGWFTAADFSGDAWDFANNIVFGDITLYARWEPDRFTSTFAASDKLPTRATMAQTNHGFGDKDNF